MNIAKYYVYVQFRKESLFICRYEYPLIIPPEEQKKTAADLETLRTNTCIGFAIINLLWLAINFMFQFKQPAMVSIPLPVSNYTFCLANIVIKYYKQRQTRLLKADGGTNSTVLCLFSPKPSHQDAVCHWSIRTFEIILIRDNTKSPGHLCLSVFLLVSFTPSLNLRSNFILLCLCVC